ncbi:MAG TPA: hypothetical protein VJ851_12040 [Jatrophihabitans sp.]|nr:hypothetical protein [Jatrophihabitans sp.]
MTDWLAWHKPYQDPHSALSQRLRLIRRHLPDWLDGRPAPDLTPAVRGWFAEAGFRELAFHAPPGMLFTVGVHRFTGRPEPLDPSGLLFAFNRG